MTGVLPLLFGIGLLVLSPLRAASAGTSGIRPRQEPPTDTPAAASVTPSDIINAVNNLRLARGLNALIVHPVLMAVAADQASALAASEGAVGHERPCGMTLGQDLLARGFPLLGDLSMDGYRSENWVTAAAVEEAMAFWQGDAEHLDTMVDPNRSHIGAAVAISDQVYMVLETALSTGSGQMQYDAYPILTGIPQTQTACYGIYTQAATLGVSVEEMLPVMRNTALPNGDVFHEVKYGQTLWTLAIQYGTTIAEIRRLNNLPPDVVIQPGQKLLIRTGATQPASGTEPPRTVTPTADSFIVTPLPGAPRPTATAAPPDQSAGEFLQQNSTVIVILVISFSVLLAGLGLFGKRKAG